MNTVFVDWTEIVSVLWGWNAGRWLAQTFDKEKEILYPEKIACLDVRLMGGAQR
jgi:hypothetical protein